MIDIKKCLFLWVLAFALISHSAFAAETTFEKVELDYGISLDIPSGWHFFSEASRKNFRASAQAMIDNANLGGVPIRKETLLAVNALPDPAGAKILVSVLPTPDFTQADLKAATKAELKALTAQTLKETKALEAAGGPKIIEMHPFQIEMFNNHRALVMSYYRAGLNEPSPWLVSQYRIPMDGYFILFTLSHRQSDENVLKPILEHVKESLRF